MTLLPTASQAIYEGSVSSVRGVYRDGTYAVMFNVSPTQIMVTTSQDGSTWTTPVLAYSNASGAGLLSLMSTGVGYTIAVVTGSAVNLLDTTTLTAWSNSRSLPAGSTSATWAGGNFYATSVTGNQVTVHRSASGGSMTLVGSLSQLNAVPNRSGIISPSLYVMFRESETEDYLTDDRVLGAQLGSYTEPVLSAAVLKGATDNAFIYHDKTGAKPFWGWMERENDRWLRRWTFSKEGEPGEGDIFTTPDGYGIAYVLDGAVRFLRMDPVPEQIAQVSPIPSAQRPPLSERLENYMIEMTLGDQWIDVSDGVNYKVSPDGWGESQQTWRRVTAQSQSYDGTYLIHATKDNVNENLTITVYGQSQNHVTENLLLLEDIVTQPAFRLRFTVGNHQEVWSCQQSDYQIYRPHVYLHNTMAQMRITIVRMPRVSYSAVI